jgi:hypothetical protein
MTVIGRKLYQVAVYFMKNVERSRRDLVRFIEKNRLAEWEFIYIEVVSKATKEYYRLILQESQLLKVVEWAEKEVEVVVQGNKKEVADLIVKSLDIGAEEKKNKYLMVSEEKYRQRDVLEKLSEIEVMKIGSHLKSIDTYDQSINKGNNDELLIDFWNKLIESTETEFSSGFYDIKIFERTYKDKISYRFELSLAPPRISDIFVVDFESKVKNRMNRVLIETIGLEENNVHSSESHSIVFTSTLVLSIFENSFPHYVEFTLLEPSTKAEWNYVRSTNVVSTMILKEKFVNMIYYNIKEGPHRKWNIANLVKVPSLAYENFDFLQFEDDSLDGSLIDFEARANQEALLSGQKPQNLPNKLYFLKCNFSEKIESGFAEEDIDGHDKFHVIFRKRIW